MVAGALSRRTFLASMAASIAAPAALCGPIQTLDDYLVGGTHYDIEAALLAGPVRLLDREYPVRPFTVRPRDVITGIPARSWLMVDGGGPAISPADPTKPTDLVTLKDFWMRSVSGNGPGIYMPSCWHWTIDNVTVQNFAGPGVWIYGQRTIDGQLDPGDSTKHYLKHVRVVRCSTGFLLSGTLGEPRISGGTANMNYLEHCLAASCAGIGFWIQQGAANQLNGCITNLCGSHGFCLSWYGNTLVSPTSETNDGWGIFFTGHQETRQNTVLGYHDGGSNGMGQHNGGGLNRVL